MKTIKSSLMSLMTIICLSAMPVYAGSMLQPLTDSVNSGIINTKIATDDALSSANIDATVINGVAIFSGQVTSVAQREELIRIARSVSGVHRIDLSKLTVMKMEKK